MAGLLGRPREAEEVGRRLAELAARMEAAEGAAAAAAREAQLDEAGRGREEEQLRTRCAALEAELAATRAALADERARGEAAAAALDALNGRVRRLEEQGDAVLPLLTAALVRRLEAEAGAGEAPDVPTALHRLDQQFKAHAAATNTALRALVERIELGRQPAG